MSARDARRAWGMAIGFALAILAVSSIPAKAMPQSQSLWRMDKLIHATEYAIFASLVFRALVHSGRRLPWAFLIAAIACALFGAVDESYQSTVPGRDASRFDVLADAIGAFFASGLCYVLYWRQRRSHGHRTQV